MKADSPLTKLEETVVLGAAVTLGALALAVEVLKGAAAWTRWQARRKALR